MGIENVIEALNTNGYFVGDYPEFIATSRFIVGEVRSTPIGLCNLVFAAQDDGTGMGATITIKERKYQENGNILEMALFGKVVEQFRTDGLIDEIISEKGFECSLVDYDQVVLNNSCDEYENHIIMYLEPDGITFYKGVTIAGGVSINGIPDFISRLYSQALNGKGYHNISLDNGKYINLHSNDYSAIVDACNAIIKHNMECIAIDNI